MAHTIEKVLVGNGMTVKFVLDGTPTTGVVIEPANGEPIHAKIPYREACKAYWNLCDKHGFRRLTKLS